MGTSRRVLAAVVALLPAALAGAAPTTFERISLAQGLSLSIIEGILQDERGFLWFATEDGLNRCDGHRFTVFRNVAGSSRSLSYNDLKCLREDRSGMLWIGTFEGGLKCFDPATGDVTRFRHEPADATSLPANIIRSLCEDRDGRIWVGTQGGGLARLDRKTGALTVHRHDPSVPGSLATDRVWSVYEERSKVLWAGTYGGGLNRRDGKTGRFERVTAADGLSSDAVYGILGDERGRLWVSTNRGLTEFDPRARTFHAGDARDGLQSDEFNGGAYLRSARGEMFFGGIGGFNAFFPSEIVARTDPARVVLTELLLANRPVPVGGKLDGRVLLHRFVGYTDEVVLSHEDDLVSIEFSALHFAAPRKIRYSYRLDGFDRDWVPAGAGQRVATYTGLPPGGYLFRVRASNPDGVWGEEEARLRIVVTPPRWPSCPTRTPSSKGSRSRASASRRSRSAATSSTS